MQETNKSSKGARITIYVLLTLFAIYYLFPLFLVLQNSFKGQFYISEAPFALPDSRTFVGWENYLYGITKIGFISIFGTSLFITVFSTCLIVLFTAMTAWYLVRVKGKFTTTLYYMFVFSMVVPFQMVMFTMSWMAQQLHLTNPVGILPLYLGFGSGMSVFMYAGFIKSIPLDIEEAATIDGCNPLQAFFMVVLPILKPTAVTIGILNAMWVWNDYLLPLLVLENKYKTLPIAIQQITTGSYGGRNMGAMMAMLVLSIVPIVIFYIAEQKHIIAGVTAGAVKG